MHCSIPGHSKHSKYNSSKARVANMIMYMYPLTSSDVLNTLSSLVSTCMSGWSSYDSKLYQQLLRMLSEKRAQCRLLSPQLLC